MSKGSKICVFNEVWLKDLKFSKWLQKAESKTKTERKLCRTVIDISTIGVSALNSHAKQNKHSQIISNTKTHSILYFYKSTAAVKQSAPECSKQSTFTNLGTGKSSVKAEIIWTLKVVKSYFSFCLYVGLNYLFRTMFHDSQIAKSFQLSKTKCSFFFFFFLYFF